MSSSTHSFQMRSVHSRAGEAEGRGSAQHVAELRPEEGRGERQPESRQPRRQLRHGGGP